MRNISAHKNFKAATGENHMKTVKQIADDMHVSKTTVRRYLKQIEAAQGTEYLKEHTQEGKAGRLLVSDEMANTIVHMLQDVPEQSGTQPEQNETQPIHEPERTGTQPEHSETNTGTDCSKPEQTETDRNTDSTNQLIELLKEQLQRKDEQIYLLNERVKDLTEALKASQTIQAMYIQKIEEHEQDPEQEPPERKNFFQKLFKL